MKSSACRHTEHDLCAPLGRVRLANGKTIGCDCSCHLMARKRHFLEEKKYREERKEAIEYRQGVDNDTASDGR